MLISKSIAAGAFLLLANPAALACDDYAEEQALAAAIAAAKAQRLAAQPPRSPGPSDLDGLAQPPRASIAALTAEPIEAAENGSPRR